MSNGIYFKITGGESGALAIKPSGPAKVGAPPLTSTRALLFTAPHTGAQGKVSCEKGILLLQKHNGKSEQGQYQVCVCV